MAEKLVLLDGYSLMYRAFHALSTPMTAPDGTPTNAVYGFLTILQKLVGEEEPDALCVCFDLKAPTFRHLAYEGYKAQRKPMPEDLVVQVPLLKEVLDAMNIPRYELEGWEADDLIGTISRRCLGDRDRHRGQGLAPTDHPDGQGQAGDHPHGADRHPGYDAGDLSGGVRL